MTSIRFDSEEDFDNACVQLLEAHTMAGEKNWLILQSLFVPRMGSKRLMCSVVLIEPEDYEDDYEYEIEYDENE